jgi:hypothetical protein
MAAAIGIGACGLPARAGAPLRMTAGGGEILIDIDFDDFDAGRDALMKWISDAAQAVTVYYGRFPVPRVSIEVRSSEDRPGVLGGTTYPGTGEAGPRTTMTVGRRTTAVQLADDWTMTHEMTHLGFPNVPRRTHWIEEGLATYVEPVARVQAGALKAERIWADMVRDMPRGVPGPGDPGFDHTRSWASTYWGGALFCLVADVRYRERTGNRRGLQDALRGILNAGGNMNVEWTAERAFRTGDEAAGAAVMEELYTQTKDAPMTVDLPGLWNRLGVSSDGRQATFRADAELSAVRAAITARRG